ncbi:thrombospondin type 3 repeat-containing protein [Flammeovirgaceae bacterium 311]|nr:thrombospondin type 3 repeat-containing protein [Flammeovirgaceae bacterium 311]
MVWTVETSKKMKSHLKSIKNKIYIGIACTAMLGSCDITEEDVVPKSIEEFRLVSDEIWDYRYPDGPSAINLDPLINDSIKVEVSVKFSQPQNGRLSVHDNDIYYTPKEGFVGVDSFTYTACSAKTCKTENIAVHIEEMPDPNTCKDAVVNDYAETAKNQWVDIWVFKNDRVCSSSGAGLVTSFQGTGSYEIIWGHSAHPNNVVLRYYPAKDFVGQEKIVYGFCANDCSEMEEATIFIDIK